MEQQVDITSYIPQREPIVMISELCSATEKKATTKLHLTEKNIFCVEGEFHEPGILENIAQTAAAMTGYNTVKNKKAVKRGFIGSINNINIFELPLVNTTIETTVEIENEVMNVHFIKGTVSQNGNTMAECTMKIFLEE